MTGGAQTIVDLLDRFDFAENITSVLIKVEHHPGKKYFVYTLYAENHITKHHSSEKEGHLQGALKKAATLHNVFNTKYIPPGFFVRLAADLTENKKYTHFLKVVPTEIT